MNIVPIPPTGGGDDFKASGKGFRKEEKGRKKERKKGWGKGKGKRKKRREKGKVKGKKGRDKCKG